MEKLLICRKKRLMDFKELDKTLNKILVLRTKLTKLSYSDEAYDQIEDQLHDIEDEFVDEYSDSLEEVVGDILNELKSDSEVLLPTSYLPQMLEGEGKQVELGDDPGVTIDIEDYLDQGVDIRLALIPSPPRFVLLVNQEIVKEMWRV